MPRLLPLRPLLARLRPGSGAGGAYVAMAADLRAARRQVAQQRRNLSAMIDTVGDALIVCDARGRVQQVNARTTELLPEARPGRNVIRDPGPLPPLSDALAGEVQIEHRGRTLAITAARLGTRRVDGVVWTVRDASERVRLEQVKSEFVATASHELRSPLTSIKGFVELLRATELSERQREFVDIVAQSTDRLAGLVDELLDVARLEAGRLELHPRPMSVGEAVGEVVALMRPRLEASEQTLHLDLGTDVPAALGDPERVRQIVTNLLTNAHAYTPPGGRLWVSVEADDDAVVLTVADSGRGMTDEQLERVFDRFDRGGLSAREGRPGTGLGLSIVQSLVDLHGGTIAVASRPGVGSRFTVRLPRAPAAAEMADPGMAIRGRRVLVVADDLEEAGRHAAALARRDAAPVVARTREEALRRLRGEAIDAVVVADGQVGGAVRAALAEIPSLRRVAVVEAAGDAGGRRNGTEAADELAEAVGSAILAGRSSALVVGADAVRPALAPALARLGLDVAWAADPAQAAALCEERRFELAVVDAGVGLEDTLARLQLRGRRLRRSVVVVSGSQDGPDLAAIEDADDATATVLAALGATVGQ